MFYDIVFPINNEEKFISVAEKLSIEGIAFAYPFSDKKAVENAKEKIALLQAKTKISLKAVFDVSGNKIYKVHDIEEIAIAKGAEGSRDLIARYKPDIVYDLELSPERDFGKFRNSGLDRASVQFARSNAITIAFSFSSILNAKDAPKMIGRVMQNIKLCRKYKLSTAIASFASTPEEMRAPHDLKSFLLSIGMHTASAKQSIDAISGLFS
jgi:hypothetical protein